MIANIINLLEEANGETEAIKIAQGKYKLSTNIKDGWEQLKREVKWQKK